MKITTDKPQNAKYLVIKECEARKSTKFDYPTSTTEHNNFFDEESWAREFIDDHDFNWHNPDYPIGEIHRTKSLSLYKLKKSLLEGKVALWKHLEKITEDGKKPSKWQWAPLVGAIKIPIDYMRGKPIIPDFYGDAKGIKKILPDLNAVEQAASFLACGALAYLF